MDGETLEHAPQLGASPRPTALRVGAHQRWRGALVGSRDLCGLSEPITTLSPGRVTLTSSAMTAPGSAANSQSRHMPGPRWRSRSEGVDVCESCSESVSARPVDLCHQLTASHRRPISRRGKPRHRFLHRQGTVAPASSSERFWSGVSLPPCSSSFRKVRVSARVAKSASVTAI